MDYKIIKSHVFTRKYYVWSGGDELKHLKITFSIQTWYIKNALFQTKTFYYKYS